MSHYSDPQHALLAKIADATTRIADSLQKPDSPVNAHDSRDEEIAHLKAHIDRLIKAGNALSIKSGNYVCAKNYYSELKNWANVING
jgi:hypothetical protein